jgi:hypothetical protein
MSLIENLPQEILENITSNLTHIEISHLSATCKNLKNKLPPVTFVYMVVHPHVQSGTHNAYPFFTLKKALKYVKEFTPYYFDVDKEYIEEKDSYIVTSGVLSPMGFKLGVTISKEIIHI